MLGELLSCAQLAHLRALTCTPSVVSYICEAGLAHSGTLSGCAVWAVGLPHLAPAPAANLAAAAWQSPALLLLLCQASPQVSLLQVQRIMLSGGAAEPARLHLPGSAGEAQACWLPEQLQARRALRLACALCASR